MALRRVSLASFVAATLVAVTTVVLGTYSVITYRSEAKQQLKTLQILTNRQADELSVALTLPLWNIDRAQVERVIDAMSQPKSVYGISVHAGGESYGRVRNPKWEYVPWNGVSATEGMIVEERTISFAGNPIGTARLLVTTKFTQNDLRASLIRLVSMVVAVDLLLVLSIYLVLWRVVVRPLTEIEKYAAEVSTEGRHNAEPPAPGFTAESESLRASIETMVHQLEERYAELKEQQEFTDTAIKSITGLFFVQDREGRFIRWNDAAEILVEDGPPLHERVGRPLIHPDDRAAVERKIDETFEVGHVEFETRLVLRGGVKNYIFSGRRMDVGDRSFLVATGVDITERRQAEAEQVRLQTEIARSAAEWKETFDTVTTPILITDQSGAIVRVNQAAVELSGLSEEQLKGTPVEQIIAGEPWQTAGQLVSHIAAGRRGTSAETKSADGKTWDVTITHFSVPNEGSERFILVFWETTNIVELQESLRRSENMSAMGALVAGVAHEVRNPLFGISATLDAYHEEMSQPGYVECGATLRQEVNRLVHLMQELLEFGKPGALTIDRGKIEQVVAEAVKSRQQAARVATVRIQNAVVTGLPALFMDRSRLRQVFENLIDNALQHTDPGGMVYLSGNVVEHAGRQWVECLVDDDGSGFAPNNLDRVFEPFFTQREDGTGLGLSIVQRIVEEHSGKVFAANRPEGGGRIRVLLPVANSDAMTEGSGS